ncbi:MAG TPA: hypothetical protein VN873_18890 [Candidatus Angelobacter sp.]|nr:hypothetical protein [Candidatus Angelobacter sp.]
MKSIEHNAPISLTQPGRKSSPWMFAFALLSGLLVFPGCASIVTGTKQNVKITSSPTAADVKVERLSYATNFVEWQGKTPAAVKLSRNGSYLVTISSDGYRTEQIPVSEGGMNGWVWGNIAFGGLIGILIDSSDGAAKNLDPGVINVNLVSKTSQGDQPTSGNATADTAAPESAPKPRSAVSPKQIAN